MIVEGYRQVDVGAVEHELVQLLREPGNASDSGLPGTRTAVLNLVAYASDRATLARIVRTVGDLAEGHPSRLIAALVDPGVTDPPLGARVQVDCRPMGTTGLNACIDQIIIEANPAVVRQLPKTVLPLLLADVPAVLWWPGEPPLRAPLLYDLLEPANRFVVDTAGFVHVERTLVALDALRRRPRQSIDLGDLNWGRLLPWRELIAQFWDVAAWRANHLNLLDTVEIQLGKPADGRSNRAQGLLLAGWLASRLRWVPVSATRLPDGYRLLAKQRRSAIEIRIRIVPDQPSGVRAVHFVHDWPRGRVQFSVTATAPECAEMRIAERERPDAYHRICRLETFTEARLLANELDMSWGDAIFEAALGAATAFLTAATSAPSPSSEPPRC